MRSHPRGRPGARRARPTSRTRSGGQETLNRRSAASGAVPNDATERRASARAEAHRTACLKPLVVSRQSPRSGGRCAVGVGAVLLVAGRVDRSRGQDGAPGAERGRTILTPARTVAGSVKGTVRVVVLSVAGTRCAGRLQFPTGGEGQARPRARLLGHVCAGSRCRVRAWSDPAQPAVLNHLRRPAGGAMPIAELSAGCVRASSPFSALGEATDLSVAQPVVDEGEDLACGGDPGDVAPSALGDAPVVGLDLAAAMVS